MSVINKFISKISNNNSKIAVFGDLIIDEYYEGEVERISPEAPIPIFKSQDDKPFKILNGGAEKVVKQIEKFALCDFYSFKNCFHPLKKRFFAKNTQVLRIDIEKDFCGLSNQQLKSQHDLLYEKFLNNKNFYSVVVFSDYNKGFFSNCEFNENLLNSGVKIIIDPKKGPLNKWKGCSIIKPNFKEACILTGTDNWKKQCDIIFKETNCEACIITNEGKSVYYKTIFGNYEEYVPYKKVFAKSVVGAGDCFISFLALSQSIGFSIEESVDLSFLMGSLYVKNHNNDPLTLDDLLKNDCSSKIKSPEFLASLGEEFVFTNGCFDAGLTPAHIECLKFAKDQGNKLVVALNSDNSVKRLKGEKRPIYSLEDRMKIMSSLEFVDYVTWFEEDTPLEVIKTIMPKKIVKGGDYKKEEVVGKEYAEVVIFDLQKCISTTEKLKMINLI